MYTQTSTCGSNTCLMNSNPTFSKIPWFVACQTDVNMVIDMNGSTDYTGEGLIWSLKLQLHRNSET
jgi:hypothetical protein